jgi:predicted RNA-binding protein with PUA-like domain
MIKDIFKNMNNNAVRYWLLKSEGSCYSIDDLAADTKKNGKTPWTGIRNYQARNFMVNDMKVGDLALFYHSSSVSEENPNGVYGIAKVVSKAHADQTALDKNDEHFDAKSTKEKPIWFCVDVKFLKKFPKPVTLRQIKIDPALSGILLAKRGMRLSILPVSEQHFKRISELGRKIEK